MPPDSHCRCLLRTRSEVGGSGYPSAEKGSKDGGSPWERPSGGGQGVGGSTMGLTHGVATVYRTRTSQDQGAWEEGF